MTDTPLLDEKLKLHHKVLGMIADKQRYAGAMLDGRELHVIAEALLDRAIEDTRALLEAEARGAERMKERAAEVIGGYPPDGFNAALYERTERYDEHDPFWKFDGDTGNWAALMGEVLKPYAEAIRNLEAKP